MRINGLRKDFVEFESQKRKRFAKSLDEFIDKRFFTNYDRVDGILGHINLFPHSPVKVMNTPELDRKEQEPSGFGNKLPLQIPGFHPSQLYLMVQTVAAEYSVVLTEAAMYLVLWTVAILLFQMA